MNNNERINVLFDRLTAKITEKIPGIIAETAIEYFQQSFYTKSFDGVEWLDAKNKKIPRERLMLKSTFLMRSIQAPVITPSQVIISAGNYKVPYAKIQNEGGTIFHPARSETFERNRYSRGPKAKLFGGEGAFKAGIKTDKIYRGHTYKSYTVTIPQRQFMGRSAELNQRIKERILGVLKEG